MASACSESHIWCREQIALMGNLDHVDFEAIAHARLLEVLPEHPINQANRREVLHPCEAHPLEVIQKRTHEPEGIGTTDTGEHRRVLDHATRHGLFVIEDRCSADLILDQTPHSPPLSAHLPDDLCLVLGTASKLLWGGLRVGKLRGAASTVRHLAQIRQGVDIVGPPVDQLVAARLLARDSEMAAPRRRALVASLHEVEAILARDRPGWRWRSPSGGVGLWVNTGEDAVALASRYRRCGVLLVPGPAFSAVDGYESYLRIPLHHDGVRLTEALRRLPD